MKPGNAGPYLFQLHLDRGRIAGRDGYPFSLPAIRGLSQIDFHEQVTFLVGENGSGKSTLLEAIADSLGLNAEGGSRNFTLQTRDPFTDDERALHRAMRFSRSPITPPDSFFLRAESFFNVATEIDRLDREGGGRRIIDSYGGESLHTKSHGEAFCALFENRFAGRGLYLLDEPEAALSPNRQLQFLALMHDYCLRGSQFVIATHSPIIMAYPESWIYGLGTGPIRRVAYDDTEHVRITRAFMAHPGKMLKTLMAED